MAGVPHFSDLEFCGNLICGAEVYRRELPGQSYHDSFNPFIPLNDQDSSIPGAFFEIEVDNTTSETVTYTICASVSNPLRVGGVNKYVLKDGFHALKLSTIGIEQGEPEYGDLTVATNSEDVSYQEYWYRGSWFDNLGIFRGSSPGRLQNRTYPESKDNKLQDALSGGTSGCAGESGKVRVGLVSRTPITF